VGEVPKRGGMLCMRVLLPSMPDAFRRRAVTCPVAAHSTPGHWHTVSGEPGPRGRVQFWTTVVFTRLASLKASRARTSARGGAPASWRPHIRSKACTGKGRHQV